MRLFVKFLQKYEFSFEIPRENSKILDYFMFFRESLLISPTSQKVCTL